MGTTPASRSYTAKWIVSDDRIVGTANAVFVAVGSSYGTERFDVVKRQAHTQ